MNRDLLDRLKVITDEERTILEQGSGVQKDRYTQSRDFTIDSKKMLEHGKLIDIRTHTRFVDFPMHKHNYVEILYMCSGQTVHTIDGNRLVLKKGELLFMNQSAYHSIDRAEEDDIGINFVVLPEFMDVAFEMIGSNNILGQFILSALRKGSEDISHLHFRVADVLPVQNLVENMIYNIITRQPNNRKINQNTMGLLMLQLLNYTDLIEQEFSVQYNGLVIAALRQIEENYKEESLQELAEAQSVSISYLSRVIKQVTGRTYKDLLVEKRMGKAAELLENSRIPVTDIITAVGYSNTSYFYREFKQRFGVTPHEYREIKRKPVK